MEVVNQFRSFQIDRSTSDFGGSGNRDSFLCKSFIGSNESNIRFGNENMSTNNEPNRTDIQPFHVKILNSKSEIHRPSSGQVLNNIKIPKTRHIFECHAYILKPVSGDSSREFCRSSDLVRIQHTTYHRDRVAMPIVVCYTMPYKNGNGDRAPGCSD